MLLLIGETYKTKLADRKSSYERRFGDRYHLGLICCLNPVSTKDNSRLHQFGTKMLLGIYIGYTLNSGGGGWTGDLSIADWHDIEDNVASDVHVERFKSKEVGIK